MGLSLTKWPEGTPMGLAYNSSFCTKKVSKQAEPLKKYIKRNHILSCHVSTSAAWRILILT